MQPETINQLKFQFFPGIFEGNYTKDFLFDEVWKPFPNGRRRRREILTDQQTGQKYEKYDGEFNEISNEPLKEFENVYDDENYGDDFDDQFEEDILEKEMLKKMSTPHAPSYLENENEVAPDLSSSRWSIYNGFAQVLNR